MSARPGHLTDYEQRLEAGTQRCFLLVRALDDEPLLEAARSMESGPYVVLRERMGPTTNPSWITARCAEEAYERGIMEADEMGWITR